MEKKEYTKPVCTIAQTDIETTLLTTSMEGGEIGGSTDHFDARGRIIFDDEEWQEEWQ